VTYLVVCVGADLVSVRSLSLRSQASALERRKEKRTTARRLAVIKRVAGATRATVPRLEPRNEERRNNCSQTRSSKKVAGATRKDVTRLAPMKPCLWQEPFGFPVKQLRFPSEFNGINVSWGKSLVTKRNN